MRISRVQIRGFRSLRDIDIPVSQICALVGPNNSGKSNFLQAVQRVLGRDWVSANSFSDDDLWQRDPNGDIAIELTFDPPLAHTKYKGADSTTIHGLKYEYTRYKVGTRKGTRRLEQSCLDAKGNMPTVLAKAPRKGEQRKYEPLVGIPSEVRDAVPLIYIGTNRSLREQLPTGRYSMLRQLLEDIDADLHDPKQVVEVQRPDGSRDPVGRAKRFQELIDEAMTILRTDAFTALEMSIKKNAIRQLGFDPETEGDRFDFFFSPLDTFEFYKLLDLRVREGGFAISATELGEGVQNVLVLAILQAFEERRKKGAILLIEEPEMFLHPQKQRSLYKTLREIGKSNQVIYTTHSPSFVCVPEYHEVRLFRAGSEGTIVRRSQLEMNETQQEKLRKELDSERNELFFASRLLLVEGDTEKLALPEFAKRLGLDPDRENTTIVEVGGKRNLLWFAGIAISFGIPTGVLFDEDSSDFGTKEKEDEAALNRKLLGLDRPDRTARAWMLSKNYERHLRTAIGEDLYLKQCGKYPGVSKAVRARLVASDAMTPVPAPIEEVLRWLVSGRTHAGITDLARSKQTDQASARVKE